MMPALDGAKPRPGELRPALLLETCLAGLSTEEEEMEQLVRVPLEDALQGLPHVARVRSASLPGRSLIWYEFNSPAGLSNGRAEAAQRLASVGATTSQWRRAADA